jgi:hypothetical protein
MWAGQCTDSIAGGQSTTPYRSACCSPLRSARYKSWGNKGAAASVSYAIRHVCLALATPSTHDSVAYIEDTGLSESRDLAPISGFLIGRYVAILEQHGRKVLP